MTTRQKVDPIKNLTGLRKSAKPTDKAPIVKRIKKILKPIPRYEYELYKEKLTKIMYGNKKQISS